MKIPASVFSIRRAACKVGEGFRYHLDAVRAWSTGSQGKAVASDGRIAVRATWSLDDETRELPEEERHPRPTMILRDDFHPSKWKGALPLEADVPPDKDGKPFNIEDAIPMYDPSQCVTCFVNPRDLARLLSIVADVSDQELVALHLPRTLKDHVLRPIKVTAWDTEQDIQVEGVVSQVHPATFTQRPAGRDDGLDSAEPVPAPPVVKTGQGEYARTWPEKEG